MIIRVIFRKKCKESLLLIIKLSKKNLLFILEGWTVVKNYFAVKLNRVDVNGDIWILENQNHQKQTVS